MIYSTPLWVLAASLVASFLFGAEVFFRVGRHEAKSAGDDPEGSIVTTLQSALLALLGLLAAFTFSMANSRFELRKSLMVEEANDLGTTWLRASFLPEPLRSESRGLLRDYLDDRIQLYENLQRDAGNDALQRFLDSASAQQDRLWELAEQAARAQPDSPVLALYLDSLNATIDVHALRVAATRNHVPPMTVQLLFLMSFGAACSVGHSAGLRGKRSFWSTAAFHALVALVIVTILDIDRPRRGSIRVEQVPLLELQAKLATD